jgi:Cu-processing system ATP-binding protein
MIEIQNLQKQFGANHVLKGVNLSVEKGGILAVLGPNGSGKTTLIKCLLGMVIPDSGAILVNGADIHGHWEYRRHINYLPQIANFPGNLRVRELLNMIKDLRRMPGDEEGLIALFRLQPFLDKKLGTLSGGTNQKVNLVMALMFNSPLLVLDEPTTGLDPASVIRLKELIAKEKARGTTILITSHIMQFVENVAEEVIYLLEGRICFKGTIPALKRATRQTDFEHAIAAIATSLENA